MKCPVCPDATLLMSERQGVEIDYCPSCRGVWLDRGELDKLIQLSGSQAAVAPQQPPQAVQRPAQPPAGYRRDFDDSDFGKHHGGHYRRKSWLSDFFD
jgi:Zn-finger nucleic acid-binding protein